MGWLLLAALLPSCANSVSADSATMNPAIRIQFAGIPVDDKVMRSYQSWPDRLYLVGVDGKIAYKGGKGPFDFKPEQLDAAIAKELVAIAE